MGIDANDYSYASFILKLLMTKYEEWKPNFDKLDEKSGTLDASFQEKIRHTMSYTIFDIKYDGWFRNREKNHENFKQLVDEEAKNYIQRGCNNEDFLSINLFIGTFGRLGYRDGITEAPDYAIGSIMYILRVFRKKRQSLPDAILSLMRWRNDTLNLDGNSDSAQNYGLFLPMNILWDTMASLKIADSPKPPISLRIDNDSTNKLEGDNYSDDVLSSETVKACYKINPNQQNYFLMKNSQNSFKNEIEVKESSDKKLRNEHVHVNCSKLCQEILNKLDFKTNELSFVIKILCSKNYSQSAKSNDDATYFNEPSTSGVIPKQMVLQPVRQFSDPTNLNLENFQKDVPSLKMETTISKNCNEQYFRIEKKYQNSDETQNEMDISGSNQTGLERYPFDSNDEDMSSPIKHILPRKRALTDGAILNEFISNEKVNTSSYPKPVKKIKMNKEVEPTELDNAH